jgi:beta-lactamase regulating signal transducer with metallopeptidase domain
MISAINEAAVALSRFVEVSILGKATLMLVVGLVVVKLAGRARASLRHLLLTATFATVFALPLIVMTAPEVTIRVPAAQSSESIAQATRTGPLVVSAPTSASVSSSGFASAVTERAVRYAPSLTAILRLVWIAGAVVLLFHLGLDLWRLYRIRRHGLPWTQRREFMQSLRAECGIRRSVEVVLYESILTPLALGIWRPAIVLPYEARDWSEADLRRAIVHELEHVRRSDWLIQLAARATCALYWFHPLVWVAFRSLSLQAERACDDAVVRGAERTEYAEQLVMLARRLSRAHSLTAPAMVNRSDLSRRVAALLDGNQRRGRAGLLSGATALSVASLIVLAIAPVRAVTQSEKPTAKSAREPGGQRDVRKSRVSSALDTALGRAAIDGDLEGIDELLRAGANINADISPGEAPSPLIGAAGLGQLEAVRLLLDRGADVNLAAGGEGTPLIAAAREGHTDIVSLLLDRGARIDQVAPNADNALIQASTRGHLDVVRLLVAGGADINAQAWAPDTEHYDVEFIGPKVFIKLSGKLLYEVPNEDKEKGQGIPELNIFGIERKGPPDQDPNQSKEDGDDETESGRATRVTMPNAVLMGKVREAADESDVAVRQYLDHVMGITVIKTKTGQEHPQKGEWRTALGMARREGHDDIVAFLLASGARE